MPPKTNKKTNRKGKGKQNKTKQKQKPDEVCNSYIILSYI